MKLTQALLVRVAFVVVGAAMLASASAAATRPNDRAGVLGVGAPVVSLSPAAAHPDNRPGIRGVGVEPVPVSPAASHPDNRAGVRGVQEVAVETNGTDWTAIGIGAGAGVVALLVLGAVGLTLRHGGHGPHRPVLGH